MSFLKGVILLSIIFFFSYLHIYSWWYDFNCDNPLIMCYENKAVAGIVVGDGIPVSKDYPLFLDIAPDIVGLKHCYSSCWDKEVNEANGWIYGEDYPNIRKIGTFDEFYPSYIESGLNHENAGLQPIFEPPYGKSGLVVKSIS